MRGPDSRKENVWLRGSNPRARMRRLPEAVRPLPLRLQALKVFHPGLLPRDGGRGLLEEAPQPGHGGLVEEDVAKGPTLHLRILPHSRPEARGVEGGLVERDDLAAARMVEAIPSVPHFAKGPTKSL